MTTGELLPRQFGKYVLIRRLAEGGMAEIYLGKQLGLEGFERNIVIKRLHSNLTASQEFVDMFLDEARLAAGLVHPNVVQITDVGVVEGRYFICMEYLAGDDFGAVLRASRQRKEYLPLPVVLKVLVEAARGLHFAHEHTDPSGRPLNVVHRDVSPSNLFVTYSGLVKVLDFGIAKAESAVSHTATGTVKGKYQYMSPEQASGERVDRRTDVYALGVTAYEALTLRRPFKRETDLAVMKAVIAGECQPLSELRPDLPPGLVDVINRAMAREPDRRHPTAADLADALETFLTSTGSTPGVSAYLSTLMGSTHVSERARIPTAKELGLVHSPDKTAVLPTPLLGGDAVTVEPTCVVPPNGRLLATITVAAAIVALGAAAFVVFRPPVAVSTPDAQPLSAVVDAGVEGPTDLGPPDAGLSEPIDAGPPPEPIDAGRPSQPVKRIELTSAVVKSVISRSASRLQGCFAKHRDVLPSSSGRVLLKLTIASSGAVSDASVDEAPEILSQCLTTAAKRLSFPPHVDTQVVVPVPLSYDIR
jgi:serine/threonine protein kinase